MLEKLKAKKAELEANVEAKMAEIEKAQAEIVNIQAKIGVVDELIAEESYIAPTPTPVRMNVNTDFVQPINGNGFTL